VKRLLLSVIFAFAVHAIILSTDFSWLKLSPTLTSESKCITIMLSANKRRALNAESVSQHMRQVLSEDSSLYNKIHAKQLKPILNEILIQDSTRILNPASIKQARQLIKAVPHPSQKIIKEKVKPKKSLKALTRKMRKVKPVEITHTVPIDKHLSVLKTEKKDYSQSASSSKPASLPLSTNLPVTRKALGVANRSSEPLTTSTDMQITDSEEISPESLSNHIATPLFKLNTPPKYPRKARRMGCEGIVILKVLVGENGRVSNFEIFQSSGYPILDKAAVSAVKMWLFEPGTKNGKKIKIWVKVPIRFKLN
jgi:protein TonB